jgi:tetratricopeptide (TPR) repeat protein
MKFHARMWMTATPTFSPAMRIRIWPITLAVLVLLKLQAFAGIDEQSQLLLARSLSNQGEFAQAIRVLEPLVHSDPAALDDASRGLAWNLLGSAHMLLGDYIEARHCYETAIHLVRRLPAASSTYASTLANLGTLETSLHLFEAAEAPLRKAKGLYAKAGDHAGLEEIALYRATLAIARDNTHAAQGFLADAFREAESVKGLSDRDRATMYSIKGSLASKTGDFAGAVSDYQQSIGFWLQACGPKCYLVGVEYALQADAYRELGDYSKAKSDITAALFLTEQTAGRNAPIYAAIELIHARVLRATGANAEAAQKEAEVSARLDAMRRQQCNGCSISAAGFR